MKHIFHKGTGENVLLLLHGTGGNEHDLVQLGEHVAPDASLLGVRGNVSEHGMPRFFRRLAEGVFDEEDLMFRTKELHEFLDESAKTYDFHRENVIALGYSNGANIAANLLFHYDQPLKAAILHHPMVPKRGTSLAELSGIPIFISAGKQDPMCPPEESTELQTLFEGAGAKVTLHWEEGGHQLAPSEVHAAAEWYKSIE